MGARPVRRLGSLTAHTPPGAPPARPPPAPVGRRPWRAGSRRRHAAQLVPAPRPGSAGSRTCLEGAGILPPPEDTRVGQRPLFTALRPSLREPGSGSFWGTILCPSPSTTPQPRSIPLPGDGRPPDEPPATSAQPPPSLRSDFLGSGSDLSLGAFWPRGPPGCFLALLRNCCGRDF